MQYDNNSSTRKSYVETIIPDWLKEYIKPHINEIVFGCYYS